MDKIDIEAWKDTEAETKIMCCMIVINELVEGYNEIDKLMKLVHEKIDYHIRKHNEVNYNKMMKGGTLSKMKSEIYNKGSSYYRANLSN